MVLRFWLKPLDQWLHLLLCKGIWQSLLAAWYINSPTFIFPSARCIPLKVRADFLSYIRKATHKYSYLSSRYNYVILTLTSNFMSSQCLVIYFPVINHLRKLSISLLLMTYSLSLLSLFYSTVFIEHIQNSTDILNEVSWQTNKCKLYYLLYMTLKLHESSLTAYTFICYEHTFALKRN